MEIVTISGTLYTDSSVAKDKNGRQFTRMTVTCGSSDPNGAPVFTHYKCICYLKGYENLKKGDQVFLTGSQKISIWVDQNGKPWLNIDVMVHHISCGYKGEDKKHFR